MEQQLNDFISGQLLDPCLVQWRCCCLHKSPFPKKKKPKGKLKMEVKWVDVHHGDSTEPECRPRPVVRSPPRHPHNPSIRCSVILQR